MGGESGEKWIHCHPPETITTLSISYTPIQKKKKVKKINLKILAAFCAEETWALWHLSVLLTQRPGQSERTRWCSIAGVAWRAAFPSVPSCLHWTVLRSWGTSLTSYYPPGTGPPNALPLVGGSACAIPVHWAPDWFPWSSLVLFLQHNSRMGSVNTTFSLLLSFPLLIPTYTLVTGLKSSWKRRTGVPGVQGAPGKYSSTKALAIWPSSSPATKCCRSASDPGCPETPVSVHGPHGWGRCWAAGLPAWLLLTLSPS